jgi:uncharacterized protein YukE
LELGPSFLTKEANQYAQNLERAKQIEEDILRLTQTINAERKKGTKEDSTKGNALTRAKAELEKLEKEKGKLDLSTGKENYLKDIENYNQQGRELKETLASVSTELDGTTDKLRKVDKELVNLKTTDPKVDFENLKNALKKCGVEAAENATTFEELKAVVQALDEEAL